MSDGVKLQVVQHGKDYAARYFSCFLIDEQQGVEIALPHLKSWRTMVDAGGQPFGVTTLELYGLCVEIVTAEELAMRKQAAPATVDGRKLLTE